MMNSNNSNNIPEKVINEIAGLIDCGLICFLNPETLEIETIMGNSYYDDYSDMRDEIFSRIDNWPKCIEIVPPESWEGFKIMEKFTLSFPETSIIRQRLLNALDRKEPFSHFKEIIETSEYKSLWFEFKHKELIELVRNQLI